MKTMLTATIEEYCNILQLGINAALQQLHCINPPIRGDIIAVAVMLADAPVTALMQWMRTNAIITFTN